MVNSTLSLFTSKDKALPQPEYEAQQHELAYEEPPFVLIKSDSALKDFVEQYTIDGRHRYDPESFLKVIKEAVTNKLQRTQTNQGQDDSQMHDERNKYGYRRRNNCGSCILLRCGNKS